ncbi:MAG: nuclear transport factor 2 family protein [Chloroflexi bacterium]|nr:nuclear transport factor 2 family protein [Chloroflexota bacterium]MDA1009966.1 nuclear transport factor 2 family protein [Chloroflexota bacterium]
MPLTDADRREIVELVARYNWALDVDRDAAAVADTFTDDGAFVSGNGTGGSGREGIVDYFSGGGERQRPGGAPVLRHWTTNHVIEGDGDEATHRCYILLIALGEAGARVDRTGIYRDRLRHVDGRWLFAERQVSIDQYPRF